MPLLPRNTAPPLVVSLDTFAQRIIHSADTGNIKDLIEVVRASEDLLVKKASDLPQLLPVLDPSKHTAPVIAILAVLSETRKTNEMLDNVAGHLVAHLDSFDRNQVVAVADIYTTLFRRLSDQLQKRPEIAGGMIELLAQAIRVLSDAWAQSSFASNVVFLPAAGAVGSDADAVLDEDEDASEDVATAENSRPSSQSAPAAKGNAGNVTTLYPRRSKHPIHTISSLHSLLFYYSLKHGFVEPALSFVKTDITDVVRENNPQIPVSKIESVPLKEKAAPVEQKVTTEPTALNARYVLQYFYYGALIAARHGDFNKARRLLEAAIAVPSAAASAIAVEAHKKLVLISLITQGTFTAPDTRSACLVRAWKARGELYNKLVIAATSTEENKSPLDNVKALAVADRRNFERDANWGLVKKLIIALEDRAILRVAKIFRRLPLETLTRRAGVGSADETWRMVTRLVLAEKLEARFDERNLVVSLEIPSKGLPTETDLDSLQSRLMAAASLAVRLDERAQLHPYYLQRTSRNASVFGNDDEGLPFSHVMQPPFEMTYS